MQAARGRGTDQELPRESKGRQRDREMGMGIGGRQREKNKHMYRVGVRLAPCLAVSLILLLPAPPS